MNRVNGHAEPGVNGRYSRLLKQKEDPEIIPAISHPFRYNSAIRVPGEAYADEGWLGKINVGKLPPVAGKGRKASDFRPPAQGDPSVLLGDRWLCKKAFALLVGQAGDGKSSLLLMLFICFAVGREAFGIRPSRPLRVMLCQAENDDGDVYEEIAGIIEGLALTAAEKLMLDRNLEIHSDLSSGYPGLIELAQRARAFEPDLLGLDPLFSFLDCGVSDQKELSHWLRQGLWPLLRELDCAAIINHHCNKPPSKRDDTKDPTNWVAADASYAGSGSAELANAARAVLHLRGLGDGRHFELRAGKRHQRLPWKSKAIQQATDKIFWEETAEDELPPRPEVGGFREFVEALNLRDPKGGEDAYKLLKTSEELKAAAQAIRRPARDYSDLATAARAEGLIDYIVIDRGRKLYGTPAAVAAAKEAK
jgi:hypothetical protein